MMGSNWIPTPAEGSPQGGFSWACLGRVGSFLGAAAVSRLFGRFFFFFSIYFYIFKLDLGIVGGAPH